MPKKVLDVSNLRTSPAREPRLSQEQSSGQRLHVIFITTSYPSTDHPQASIFTHRAIKVLSSEIEAEVIEFCSWRRGRRPLISHREYDGVPVLSFACPRIPLQKALHLNSLIQAYFGAHLLRPHLRNADLLHAASLYPPGFIAGQWAKSVQKPCTAHAIGSDVNFLLPQIRKALFFRPPWHLDGIACESEDMRKKVIPFFPHSQNIQVVYRGVDTEKFSQSGVQPAGASHGSALCFLFLGGFASWDAQDPFYNLKGGPLLLQAWQQIERQIAPDVLLIGGPQTDTYKTHLEDWRASLARPEAVSFLPALPPDAIPDVIRRSDVVVIPSLFEGLPNLAKEAQACGRPVLGTDAGGIPEAVLHGQTGWIIPRGDLDALASGFSWFHANRDKIRTLGRNARDHVKRRFSWKGFSTSMMEFFRAAVEIHGSE